LVSSPWAKRIVSSHILGQIPIDKSSLRRCGGWRVELPVAAAAIFFGIRSRAKEPDAPDRAFA
jgi:hypothetical protein